MPTEKVTNISEQLRKLYKCRQRLCECIGTGAMQLCQSAVIAYIKTCEILIYSCNTIAFNEVKL